LVWNCAGSSSNGSNNTSSNKESPSGGSSSTADRSASGRLTGGDTDDTVKPRPSALRHHDRPGPAVQGQDIASPGGSGSLDDEWSRQMDELDQLRPAVAFDDRLVVDSFTDLPDIVIDDDDDDVNDDDVKRTTVEQVTTVVVKFETF